VKRPNPWKIGLGKEVLAKLAALRYSEYVMRPQGVRMALKIKTVAVVKTPGLHLLKAKKKTKAQLAQEAELVRAQLDLLFGKASDELRRSGPAFGARKAEKWLTQHFPDVNYQELRAWEWEQSHAWMHRKRKRRAKN
jgi:hypothetical protein